MVRYKLPFPKSIEYKIIKPTGSFAHEHFYESKYAVDFDLHINTPVLAACSGIVLRIKDDSDVWGLDIKLANDANFVLIKHEDGSYAEYMHLKKDSIIVKENDHVNTGDLLGFTGLSGCMKYPHLHFNVFIIEDGKTVSIPFEVDYD